MDNRNITRPLLAATLTSESLKGLVYPILASPKLDGIRVRVFPEGAMSRQHKLIPNHYVQKVVSGHQDWLYLDGEIIAGSPTDPACFNKTQSAVMSEAGGPQFKFYVFDCFEHPDKPYIERLNKPVTQDQYLEVVPQKLINNEKELLIFENEMIDAGYEGIMVRKMNGRYKFGRSTANEGLLFKLKRLQDAEATVIGVEPLQHNMNHAHWDARGYMKRSTAKAGKRNSEFIGKFIVDTPEWGQFKIGTSGAKFLMIDQEEYMGKQITFTYQPVGMKEVPRMPIFKGFRAD